MTTIAAPQSTPCYHCGLACQDETFASTGKSFCCRGCRLAYEILNEAGLTDYYHLNTNPGISLKQSQNKLYAELDDERILCQVCDFQNDRIVDVTFSVPQIHCSSCVWLLENLYRLNPGIRHSQVDFFKKTLTLSYERGQTSLRQIAQTLASLGYAPQMRDPADQKNIQTSQKKTLYLKIGVAGFCFGNVMLLSFPDYLLPKSETLGEFGSLFAYLTLLLSLPVLLFSASDYFLSALRALRTRRINIDVPLALGLFSLFARSVYDVLALKHIGYLDSFTGLVFFLLLGRAFKEKTFDVLNFERTYESYFPLSLQRLVNGVEQITPLSEIRLGDHLRLRNQEIIPADSILRSKQALIDYSFVTGESVPQHAEKGQPIYAGGRQLGEAIEVEVIKPVSQSHLTRLWNNNIFKTTKRKRFTQISEHIGRYFTWVTLAVGLISFGAWSTVSQDKALLVLTSVLLVACPCALALAFPFTFGTAMRILGRQGIYLRNMDVLETLSWIDTIAFDKTGTLTHTQKTDIQFQPTVQQKDLSHDEKCLVQVLVSHSTHPLSVALGKVLPKNPSLTMNDFQEIAGKGLCANINDQTVKVGRSDFVGLSKQTHNDDHHTRIFLSIDGEIRGSFLMTQVYRHSLTDVVKNLGLRFRLFLLSGDKARDQKKLSHEIFQDQAQALLFQQSPEDKMNFIKDQVAQGRYVAMIGDGLNDAGALRQSDVGIAITEDVNAFCPASDLIVSGSSFELLPRVFEAAQACVFVLKATVAVSLIYNFIGLTFAVTGHLSPLVSAVLMPISSITVMTFSSFMTKKKLATLGFHLDSTDNAHQIKPQLAFTNGSLS